MTLIKYIYIYKYYKNKRNQSNFKTSYLKKIRNKIKLFNSRAFKIDMIIHIKCLIFGLLNKNMIDINCFLSSFFLLLD